MKSLIVILGWTLLACNMSHADALSAFQQLRQDGCGGQWPATAPLRRNALLDRAARDWAAQAHNAGSPTAASSPAAAVERSGYKSRVLAGLHISGADSLAMQTLRRSSCGTISDRGLQDIGAFQHGSESWLLMAAAYAAPNRNEASLMAAGVLDLVNEARAHGALCGGRAFSSAPPVKISGTLAGVAFGHAKDMADHDYFDHKDLAGGTPAERVRAAGYREKLVGENIAYGPQSADEVVRGWLESPGHCENIMDPRFAEMGVAYAAGNAAKAGLYWVQLLAAPRSPATSN